jgi:acid stress-induced BolA-like protein IbaG/YrbA
MILNKIEILLEFNGWNVKKINHQFKNPSRSLRQFMMRMMEKLNPVLKPREIHALLLR